MYTASVPVKGQGVEAHVGLLEPRRRESLLCHIFYARTALYAEAGHGRHNTTLYLRTRFSVSNGWSISAEQNTVSRIIVLRSYLCAKQCFQ